jgi:nucleoside-diphosphate-sugar epimerase
VKHLVDQGYWVRGVDIKHPEYEPSPSHEFELLDLRRFDNCLIASRGIDEVYHLAADHKRQILLHTLRILVQRSALARGTRFGV